VTGCLSKVNTNSCDRHFGWMRNLSRDPALVITTELAVAAGGLDRRGALLPVDAPKGSRAQRPQLDCLARAKAKSQKAWTLELC
jgi:hypothetical protein